MPSNIVLSNSHTYEPSNEVFLNVLEQGFNKLLLDHNFDYVDKFKWAKKINDEIYFIFNLYLLKGNRYAPQWGISLVNVPIFKSNKIKYSKSAKSLKFDLTYDPIDYFKPFDEWVINKSHHRNEESFISRVDEFTKLITTHVLSYSNRIKSINDLITLYEETINNKDIVRFGFFNRPQQVLSYSFVLKKIGNDAKAYEFIEMFIKKYRIEESLGNKLKSALEG